MLNEDLKKLKEDKKDLVSYHIFMEIFAILLGAIASYYGNVNFLFSILSMTMLTQVTAGLTAHSLYKEIFQLKKRIKEMKKGSAIQNDKSEDKNLEQILEDDIQKGCAIEKEKKEDIVVSKDEFMNSDLECKYTPKVDEITEENIENVPTRSLTLNKNNKY